MGHVREQKLSVHEKINIIEAISYKPGWTIHCWSEDDGTVGVQVSVDETTDASMDALVRDGSVRTPWKSGKRYISAHACSQEVVGSVFGLIQDAESHEMREWFRFRGASIYNPHLDPEALVPLARQAVSFVIRRNAMVPE
jgi:hypothetical protein